MFKFWLFHKTKDTRKHIRMVRKNISLVIKLLKKRSRNHDKSKLSKPEMNEFYKYGKEMKNMKYGSHEYNECLRKMKPAVDHHYKYNRHHPEFFPNKFICKICNTKYLLQELNVSNGRCLHCKTDSFIKINSFKQMNLIDITEMLMDWSAAIDRNKNGNIFDSIEINQKRFGYSDEVKELLKNTMLYIHSNDIYI